MDNGIEPFTYGMPEYRREFIRDILFFQYLASHRIVYIMIYISYLISVLDNLASSVAGLPLV